MKTSTKKIYIILHILLAVFSLSGIFSKMAAGEEFLSIKWCLCYGCVIFILGIYALGWQQIIKRMPLTAAYANKAVTTAWGLVWGVLFFGEKVTAGKIIGLIIVIVGVVLFAIADAENEQEGEA